MNRAGNTYWLNNRRTTQGAAAQVIPAFSVAARTGVLTPAAVRAWILTIPSWVILAMIILATLAICSTVIMRTRTQLQMSAREYQDMASEIAKLRRDNALLQIETRRMTTDTGLIESTARLRLGMVGPNDIVVPIESTKAPSNLGTLSFVR